MKAAPSIDLADYRERILRDGFAVVEDLVPAEQIEELRDAIASLPAGEEMRRKRNTYGVRNLLHVCPAARRLAASPHIRPLAAAVLGDACFAVRAVFFDKVPDANWKLGWHQDSVIAVRERREVAGFTGWAMKAGVQQVQPPPEVLAEMLALRVHLDDCGEDNGPLRVLPGSHQSGWADDRIEHWVQNSTAETCRVRSGGVVAMRPLLLHASSAAARPAHRRVIHLEFACRNLPDGLEWDQRIGLGWKA